jgi:hypothetical protein
MRMRWCVLVLIASGCDGGGTGTNDDGGGGGDGSGSGDGGGGSLPELVATNLEGMNAAEIAIAPDGSPRIAFISGNMRELSYAEPNGSAWLVEKVPTPPDNGRMVAIAVDGAGVVHLLHSATATELRYLRRQNGMWTSVTVTGRFPLALAIGSSNSVHIAFSDIANSDIHYGAWNGASFTSERVTSTLLRSIDIAVAGDGTVHIIADAHVFGTPGAFTTESIAAGISSPSVAVESGGQVDVVATVQNARVVRFRRDGTWTQSELAMSGAIETSIAVDATNAVHAAAVAAGVFHYYKPNGTGTNDVTIATNTYGGLGDLTVAADGTAHALFPASGSGSGVDLHYVRP